MSLAEKTRDRAGGAQTGPWRYRAYGMAIVSELFLPELEPDEGSGAPDLTIRLAPTGRSAPETYSTNTFDFGETEQFMCWPVVGAFLIRGTHAIDIERAPGVSDALLPFPLLGPVMAMLLHLKGLLVLHASCVAVGSQGAVFLGDKLAGKSTTAAAFVRAGHRLVTDDVLAIEGDQAGRLQILPAFPQIKLAEDAEAAVRIEGAEARPLVLPDFEKRQQRLTGRFSQDRVAPGGLYVLHRASEARAVRLSATDSLSAAIQFSYITRFASRALPPHQAREHLRQCAMLVSAAPVYRLETPSDLARLDEVVRLVEGQLA